MAADPRDAQVSIGAAVDIGSNSIHLLVGLLTPYDLEPLRDRSVFLGLGAVVDWYGEVPAASRRRVTRTLRACRELALRSGAETLTLLGTEPLRRASNTDQLCDDVLAATGLAIHVLSEHEEAMLTYIGVTTGTQPPAPLIVVDIGGGSTEVSIYVPGEGLVVTSIPTGSARLTEAFVRNDPPTDEEVRLMRLVVADELRGLTVPAIGSARAVFVGGTATNVARLGRLSREALANDRRTIETLPAAAVSKRFAVRARRARQLAAGVAIIEEVLDRFGIEGADVSEASLRDGAIIAAGRFGDVWPARLDDLVSR